MNPTIKSIALVLLMLSSLPGSSQAQVAGAPATIDYQGQVLDATGAVLAPTTPTNYTMQFRIYSTQSGGAILWSESQIVTVDKGAFSVQLGSGVRIPATGGGNEGTITDLRQAFDASTRYLGLTVVIPSQTPVEVTPRLAFLSSPYSLVAERAKLADSVSQTALQTSTLGATTVSNTFTLNAAGRVSGANALEFGSGIAGKNSDAGKIGYGALTPGTLDIVGAGSTATDRKVKIFAEGGLTVAGPQTVSGILTLDGGGKITGANTLEFGSGIAGKNSDAGKIGYAALTAGTLDIVGAGTNTTDRKVKIFAEGGLTVAGPQTVTGALTVTGAQTINNSLTVNGNQTIIGASSLSFGVGVRQMINLWSTSYGIGVQSNTFYARSGGNFAWYQNGSHTDTELNPGSGGTTMATLTSSGFNVLVGNVGIGTATPTGARLVVNGGVDTTGMYGAYIANNSYGGPVSHGTHTVSIKTSNSINCGGAVIATSDERIKNVIGQSDGSADLKTLLGIEIADFTYRDSVSNMGTPQKKVIAQQVEKIFPQAVYAGTGVIPDIYQKSTVKDGWVHLATNLKAGERVKLISEEGESLHEVKEVAAGRFRTDATVKDGEIFVFGREVNDLRSVDYEAIAMLNVSATQELKKQSDAANQALTEKNAALEQKLAAAEKRLAALEAQIGRLADAAAHKTDIQTASIVTP